MPLSIVIQYPSSRTTMKDPHGYESCQITVNTLLSSVHKFCAGVTSAQQTKAGLIKFIMDDFRRQTHLPSHSLPKIPITVTVSICRQSVWQCDCVQLTTNNGKDRGRIRVVVMVEMRVYPRTSRRCSKERKSVPFAVHFTNRARWLRALGAGAGYLSSTASRQRNK